MKILFMGTPDFARSSLEALVKSGEDVCAVVTQPDKPVGRKRIITPSPVKVFALENSINVYQPEKLRDGEFEKFLNEIAPELIVVVAYGRILPKFILDFPKYGCVNVHGSLLPKYRGAAPIQRSMLAGDDVTGVTTMYMDEGMDTGDMILQEKLEISETENLEELYARLADLGAGLLLKTLEQIKAGTVKRTVQDGSLATVAPKLSREDEKLDFSLPTKLVMRKINCMIPSPGANAVMGGKTIKIFKAEPYGESVLGKCGEILSFDKKSITVKTSDGAIKLLEIMEEGGKRMPVSAYLCGKKPVLGEVIS